MGDSFILAAAVLSGIFLGGFTAFIILKGNIARAWESGAAEAGRENAALAERIKGLDVRALEYRKELDEKNRKRQQVDMDVYEEAVSIIENQNLAKRNSIVLAKENWHEGVIGIVASRIVEKYNKPTIMISLSDEYGKGSGRSIPEFHLYDALAEIEDILESFGGHRLAAGITIKRENLNDFVSRFEELTLAKLGKDEITRKLDIDCEIDIHVR